MKQVFAPILPLVTFFLFSCDSKPKSTLSSDVDKLLMESKIKARVDSTLNASQFRQMQQDTATLQFAPVEILSATISKGSIPRVSVTVRNKSENEIDGVKVGLYCYNNFEEPVNGNMGISNHYTGIAQRILRPGKKDVYELDLVSFEGATKVYAYIREVHFTNGSRWNYETYLK